MSKYKVTHIPSLVDNPIINSTGFLDALNNYRWTIDGFLDLYSIASIHKTNKQLHDPVTHQVDFFKTLNSGDLPIKENRKGVTNDNVLNSLDIRTDDFYTKFQEIAADLPENFGLDDIWETDTEFLVYWIEKYRTSHDLVKELLHNADVLPKETEDGVYNTENVYFNDFSESMFSLKTTTLYDPPREAIPTWDIKSTFFKEMGGKHTVPNQYTGTSVYNVHNDTRELAFIMSRKTSAVFRNNMKNVLECVSSDSRIEDEETGQLLLKKVLITDSKQAHGCNLVHDGYHIGRAKQNAEPISRIVHETLSNMAYVLSYMDKNLRNNQKTWGKINVQSSIEDVIVSVDLLHDRLEYSKKEEPVSIKTNQSVLG